MKSFFVSDQQDSVQYSRLRHIYKAGDSISTFDTVILNPKKSTALYNFSSTNGKNGSSKGYMFIYQPKTTYPPSQLCGKATYNYYAENFEPLRFLLEG
ncbi:hypothetical protein MMC28_001451 [Mycoblastus sanguinarius]|nr:hypothetical protein [Mycoblastus sanguinarius]